MHNRIKFNRLLLRYWNYTEPKFYSNVEISIPAILNFHSFSKPTSHTEACRTNGKMKFLEQSSTSLNDSKEMNDL